MIIHQRTIAVIALFVSLLLITLDFYYSEKTNQKDYEIKLDKQLIDSEQNIGDQHHEGVSSPCGM